MYIEIKLWSCTNFTLQGNSLFLKNIYIFKYLVLCNRDYMNTKICKIGRFIYWIFLFVLFCANSKSLFFVLLSASICLVLLLLLFFSILRRLGDFASRNRKKRFNSWNTQLCLWFTVAAFHSSTAAERTHSILEIKKKSISCINKYHCLTWLGCVSFILANMSPEKYFFSILYEIFWPCFSQTFQVDKLFYLQVNIVMPSVVRRNF